MKNLNQTQQNHNFVANESTQVLLNNLREILDYAFRNDSSTRMHIKPFDENNKNKLVNAIRSYGLDVLNKEDSDGYIVVGCSEDDAEANRLKFFMKEKGLKFWVIKSKNSDFHPGEEIPINIE